MGVSKKSGRYFPRTSEKRVQGVGFITFFSSELSREPITEKTWEQVLSLVGRELSWHMLWLLRKRGFHMLTKKDFRGGEGSQLMDIWHNGGVLE